VSDEVCAITTASIPPAGVCGAKPCWKPTRHGFSYADKFLAADGIQQLTLTEGLDGKAKITLKGHGVNLDMPPLPLTPPVRVQLKSTAGVCWEAKYSLPTKNDPTQFKAKDRPAATPSASPASTPTLSASVTPGTATATPIPMETSVPTLTATSAVSESPITTLTPTATATFPALPTLTATPTPAVTATPQNRSVLCSSLQAPPGAIYLDADAPTDPTFQGSTFQINGNDVNYTNGVAGPQPAVPGITTRTEGNAQATRDGLSDLQKDNVQGLGYVAGSPSVPSVSASTDAPTSAQIDQLITDLLALPHDTYTQSNFSGNETFGTTAAPRTSYFNNAIGVTMGNGNASGAGILIVENSLTLNGNFDFKGLVLVRGTMNVTSGTGSANIWGTLWTTDFNLTVGASADIQYSSQGLALAANASGSIPCEPSVCGDGIRSYAEACDDGNQISGDGCSSTCTLEATPTPDTTP
jgi:cysteine-rich repeat protein